MGNFSNPNYRGGGYERSLKDMVCSNCGHTFGRHTGEACPSYAAVGHVKAAAPKVVECKSPHCECDETARAHCSAKLTDQAFKADGGKPRFDLLMDGAPHALLDVVKVLTWAIEVKLYVPHSWKEVPDAKRRYRAALQRHENAIARGEVNDPESGLPHRAHIACNAIFLAELDYITE